MSVVVDLGQRIEARRRARWQEIARAELIAQPDLHWASWLLKLTLETLAEDQRAALRDALEGRDAKHTINDGPRPVEAIVARYLLFAALADEQVRRRR